MAEDELTDKDRLVGYIDLLGGGLTVLGWAWFEQDPERRADIEFLINGEVAGSAIADRHRPDVEQAGRGDGRYGFAWPLAFAALPVAEEIVISARDRASRQELANAIKLSAGDLLARLKEFAARSEPGERKLAALRAAARLAPDDPWHALSLAEALRRDGQPEAAEAALRALLDQHPHFWHAHVALGNLARAGNDPSELWHGTARPRNWRPVMSGAGWMWPRSCGLSTG
ncbi:hypothetical protein [Acidocella sp.]|uniref:hypothetical protein n=1 Tax=Acidocella sp. TaxID=50710 RepID=UPI0026190435|nr:hypothetical protein [Acidocella sp.]